MGARGEQNSKLKESEVLDIYQLAHSGRYLLRQIGEAFGISLSQVWMIKHRKEWKWLLNQEKENPAMSDEKTKPTDEANFQNKLVALQATLTKLAQAQKEEARLRQSSTQNLAREMADAVPTNVVRDIAFDPGLRRVSEPSSMIPQSGQAQVVRGSGYRDAAPLGPVPGLSIMDGMLDAQDRQDRAELERRLARSVKPKE